MNYKKILKKSLRIIAYLMAVLAIVWLGLFIYLSRPWIVNIEESRTTGKLETIRATWGRDCGEDFLAEENSGLKLTLVVPDGGKTPGQTRAAVPDNEFIITGYRYKRVQKNLLSGEVRQLPARRFDVIAWHVVTPYKAYVDDPDVLIKEVSTPLGWHSEVPDPAFISSRPSPAGKC